MSAARFEYVVGDSFIQKIFLLSKNDNFAMEISSFFLYTLYRKLTIKIYLCDDIIAILFIYEKVSVHRKFQLESW